ncbi:hypothetical protein Q9233_003276 [Columba guinea]|nr:hypothetical protein Q9233_003276 [Columba guinea]
MLALWCGGSLGLWSEPAWLERLGVLQNFQQPLTESFVFLFPQLAKVTSKVLSEQPKSRQLMTSDQDTKVVAEPQVQQVQEVKDGSHLLNNYQVLSWASVNGFSNCGVLSFVSAYRYCKYKLSHIIGSKHKKNSQGYIWDELLFLDKE